MKRHRNRRQKPTQKLNLVALMDIFTILVFFLMVNSSDVQIKETHESVTLPKSTTTELPTDSLKLYITKNYMFLDGDNRQISLTSFSKETGTYPELVSILEAKAVLNSKLTNIREPETGLPIIILGDQTTHYTIIQQVLASCAQTSFRDVSLAVIFTEDEKQTSAQLQSQPNRSYATDTLAAATTTLSILGRNYFGEL